MSNSGSAPMYAFVILREEGKRPIISCPIRGDDEISILQKAIEWFRAQARTVAETHTSIQWSTSFDGIMVCGILPDGDSFCLPERLSGTFRKIVDDAIALLTQLVEQLRARIEGVSTGSVNYAYLESALAQGHAIRIRGVRLSSDYRQVKRRIDIV